MKCAMSIVSACEIESAMLKLKAKILTPGRIFQAIVAVFFKHQDRATAFCATSIVSFLEALLDS